MILKTDFQRSGAGKLLKYIRRDREQDTKGQKVPLRDRLGREVDEQRIERFVAKSERFGFQRHLIVSPDPDAGFSSDEVGSKTREFMQSEFGQQPTTDYIYAVHDDSDIVHTHVAATGQERELQMDADDLERLRGRAKDVFREPERLKEQAPEREPESHSEIGAADSTLAESASVDAEREADTAPERDFDFGGGQ